MSIFRARREVGLRSLCDSFSSTFVQPSSSEDSYGGASSRRNSRLIIIFFLSRVLRSQSGLVFRRGLAAVEMQHLNRSWGFLGPVRYHLLRYTQVHFVGRRIEARMFRSKGSSLPVVKLSKGPAV